MNDSSLKSHVAIVVLVVAFAGAPLFLATPSLRAKDPVYERATLLSMDSQTCGSTESGGKTVAGEIMGTDAGHHTTQEVLCQDYVLQSDRLIYHIRVKDAKHPVLLPVGNAVEFRIEKSSLFLRDPENGKQEHEYVVISMQPRTDVSTVGAAGRATATTAATDTTAEPKPQARKQFLNFIQRIRPIPRPAPHSLARVVVGGMVTAPFAILLLIPVLASIWPKPESGRLPATSN